MPSLGLLLLHVRWWRKQTEMQEVNIFHCILEHLPLKRLAEGIAVKTKVLTPSWREEIYTRVFFWPASASLKTHLWDVYMIPFCKDPSLDGMVYFCSRTTVDVIYPTPKMASWPILVELPFAPFTVFLYKEAGGDQPGRCLWLLEMWESYLFLCFFPFVFPSCQLLFH